MPTSVVVSTLLVFLLVMTVLSVGAGAISIDPQRIVRIIADRMAGSGASGPMDFIIWDLRMPRVVQAVVVGAGLAVAGACVQVLVRNPIADPYVLGLSSGAGVAAVLIITTVGVATVGAFLLPIAAFIGAAATGAVVAMTAASRWGLSAGRLILSGVAVGQLLGGVMSFLLIRSGNSDATQQVIFWLLGSLAGSQWSLIAIIAPVIIATIAATLALAGRLDLLGLGDAHAAASGANPGRTRLVVFALASLLTGAAVAASGTIGFVGLIIPHIARLLVGGMHRRVIPVSALLGAILLVVADLAARTVLAPSELPVGIFTAAIGVPIFIFLMRRNRTTAFS
ncbi:iron ABC transporter permease [Agreia sp. VKM Ac-1783]|uniref:FecCD family ABC transporter permease n=1 Tax=Agreia sp. VKM Ac-1783 TaxID=1938889 RepID=UPI0020160432|nr:iron ABC transporter permease [Agreia sp. VKM Ac-1783]